MYSYALQSVVSYALRCAAVVARHPRDVLSESCSTHHPPSSASSRALRQFYSFTFVQFHKSIDVHKSMFTSRRHHGSSLASSSPSPSLASASVSSPSSSSSMFSSAKTLVASILAFSSGAKTIGLRLASGCTADLDRGLGAGTSPFAATPAFALTRSFSSWILRSASAIFAVVSTGLADPKGLGLDDEPAAAFSASAAFSAASADLGLSSSFFLPSGGAASGSRSNERRPRSPPPPPRGAW
mmetsp:Transcript_11937/g.53955  ORF Transcript_11937/g.53955 Transcript_11937/m.53955 type:complete len:241 (+) Transcript_11937:2481-3203(+)